MAGKRSEKVEEAMRLIREEKMTAYGAAKAAGCPQASVFSRLRTQRAQDKAPLPAPEKDVVITALQVLDAEADRLSLEQRRTVKAQLQRLIDHRY